jgi:hypothetical protein
MSERMSSHWWNAFCWDSEKERKMKRHYRFLALALGIFLLGGCSFKRAYMIDQAPKMAPSEGKALVNFVRPSSYGGLAKATIWDGDKLIGVSFGNQRFQYECEPGKHLFIAWSEYKSPVEAELAPNKVYYIALRIRMGWARGRIHQVPIKPGDPLWNEVVPAMGSLPNRTFDQQALASAEAEGKLKIIDYLQYYESNVKGTKHVLYLNPGDGVTVGSALLTSQPSPPDADAPAEQLEEEE